MTSTRSSCLILGGAGLVGLQVAKRAATVLRPRSITIASRYRSEVRDALTVLRREHNGLRFFGYYGDIYARGTPLDADRDHSRVDDREYSASSRLEESFSDTYVDFPVAYRESLLVQLIRQTRPEVIVDCVNAATVISYKDTFSQAQVIHDQISNARRGNLMLGDLLQSVERLLASLEIPQVVLHVRLLHRALIEARVRAYIKVGTTGTGGMGLTIPYTHGEDKPSPTLMAKNAVAFAQTGLLFLLARTPGAPIVKEIKPAALIGYRDVRIRTVQERDGKPMALYEPREARLGDYLDTRPDSSTWAPACDEHGREMHLELACVNTGENGYFAGGEFETITALGQMEFLTPEEIADTVVREVTGANTGRDIMAAIDGAVMGPSYKGGMMRRIALEQLDLLQQKDGAMPSIAIGHLGPPQLAKYLFEAYLWKKLFGNLEAILQTGSHDDESAACSQIQDAADAMVREVMAKPLGMYITSIGIPILLPDGCRILRGPRLKIPSHDPSVPLVALGDENIGKYADRGWIDLRPVHLTWWLRVFDAMRRSSYLRGKTWSSESVTRGTYLFREIKIGEIVSWIFSNRLLPEGYRVK